MELVDQLKNRCIHFNGIMNECCMAGIKYADVRVGRPYKFPCIKTGGECAKSEFLSDEQAKMQAKEIDEQGLKTATAYINIKEHYQKTKQLQGKLPCECGGELNYTVAKSNGHIWAKCTKCDIRFNE